MRKLLYACYHLLILLVVGAGVFLSAEVLHAQSLAELVSALPEGTIPFLDREARESLLSCSSMGKKISITPSGAPNGFVVPASASSDQGSLKVNSVHAFGQLVPLEIIHCTESYLSFRTGEVIHAFAALPYGNRKILCYIVTIENPFAHSEIMFFDQMGEAMPETDFFPSNVAELLLPPSTPPRDRAELSSLARRLTLSPEDFSLTLSLIPESASSLEAQGHWREILRPTPIRLEWKRRRFRLR